MEHLLIASCLLMIHLCVAQQQSCPSFGDDSTESVRPYSTEERLYLNFKEPSQCNGTVTRWNFCFFNARSTEGITLGVRFMVYRRSNTPQVYTVVPNSMYTLQVNSTVYPMQGCANVELNESQHFQILENDIIAACVLENVGERYPLFVTSTGRVDAIQVYEQRCIDDQLGTIDLGRLNHRIRNALHLHATLDTVISPRIGTNPPSFPLLEAKGAFLNAQFPAESDGVVSSWHYCYYPAMANDSLQTYSASVAVWRYEGIAQQYRLLNETTTVLELQPETNVLTDIYCTQQMLDPASPIRVVRGDIVGVVLTTNPIPMLGRSSQHTLMRNSESRLPPGDLSSNSLTSEQMALHLYADIMMEVPTTTDIPTTTSTTTNQPIPTTTNIPTTTVNTTTFASSTSSTTNEDAPSISPAIWGLIFVCLILLLGSIATAIIIAVLVMKMRRKRRINRPTVFGKGTIKKTSDSGVDLLGLKNRYQDSVMVKSSEEPKDAEFLTSTNTAYGVVGDEEVTSDEMFYSEVSVVGGRPMTTAVPAEYEQVQLQAKGSSTARLQQNEAVHNTVPNDNNYI